MGEQGRGNPEARMRSSTGMYSLGAGVLLLGTIMGVRYTAGLTPSGAVASPLPPPAPAAAPAFVNLDPSRPLHTADPDKPRYFGPEGMSLLIARSADPDPAAPPQHRAAIVSATDQRR